LFRAKTVPDTVRVCLQLAADQYGFFPRRSPADYVRKGTSKDYWAGWAWQELDLLIRKHRSNIERRCKKKQGYGMHMHIVTIYPSPPRATASAGAATLGAAAAINRGGSTTVTAAATVAREVTSARTRVTAMIDIVIRRRGTEFVTWWTAADLDSGYRVQQFWQELEDLKPL
jgi:hypothetical protein